VKIDISEVLKAVGNEMKLEEAEKISFPQDDLILSKPVKFKMRLINAGRTVLLRGNIKTAAKLNCCRCLKDFEWPVSVDIEEEFARKNHKSDKKNVKNKTGEIELEKEDFIFEIGDDNSIDLAETIRQNLLTVLPIKPLCSKNCKGIGGEAKKEKKLDPRLAKLKNIFKK